VLLLLVLRENLFFVLIVKGIWPRIPLLTFCFSTLWNGMIDHNLINFDWLCTFYNIRSEQQLDLLIITWLICEYLFSIIFTFKKGVGVFMGYDCILLY